MESNLKYKNHNMRSFKKIQYFKEGYSEAFLFIVSEAETIYKLKLDTLEGYELKDREIKSRISSIRLYVFSFIYARASTELFLYFCPHGVADYEALESEFIRFFRVKTLLYTILKNYRAQHAIIKDPTCCMMEELEAN